MAPTDLPEDEPWRVRDIIDALYGFIGIYELDGTLIEANEAPLRAANLSRADVIGKPFWETYWWGHSKDAQAELKSAMMQASEGKTVRYDTRVQLSDDQIIVIDISFGPLCNRNGDQTHIIGFAVDRTEREKAFEEIKRQRDFAEHLVDAAPGIVLVLDMRGAIRHVNRYFEDLAGFKLSEIRGKDWFSTFLPLPDQDRIREVFANCARDMPVNGYINPIVTRHGEEREIEWHDRLLRDADGQPVSLLCIGQDVTERSTTQSALRRSQKLLAEAQRLASVGSWELNLVTNALTWSDEVYRIFEIDPRHFGASYEAFLNAIHPDDRDAVNAAYTNSLETKTPYNIEHRLKMPDGRIKYVVENCETHYREDGTPLRSIGTVQDMTERRLMEEELRASKMQAEQASSAKSEFLSRMSHELRTPLNAIIGFSQVLQLSNETSKSPAQARYVQEISRAGAHLLDLVNEVLELSRIEAGQVDVNIESVQIATILNDAFALVEPLAKDRSIRIEVDSASRHSATVMADRIRLKQVLLNLLSNAVKYGHEGGKVTASICEPEPGLWRISVTDNGPGIALEKQKELFEPFNRLGSEKTEIEGTGIGLAISKRLAMTMGGRLGFASKPGAGSSFWIDLPQGREEAVAHIESLGGPTKAARLAEKCVLYVEDNPANVRLMEAVFEKVSNAELLTAHTGELGLELARNVQPNLILMDITLPGINGLLALESLRAEPATRDIPVVAISANAMPHDIERALNSGFAEYLTKPLHIPQFLEVLGRYVDCSDAA